METFGNQIKPKTSPNYYCETCDYISCKKSNYATHLMTLKHLKCTNGNVLETAGNQNKPKTSSKFYSCDNCQKKFKNRSGLWKHNKLCIIEPEKDVKDDQTDKDLILLLLKQNNDLQNKVLEICKNGITNNTISNTINNNNKTFNLQFFLNETCKNAMNISEFVDSIKLQISDLESVGKIGYVEGLTKIILKRLNALDITERPVHCSDTKRDTLYVKDDNKWEKEA